MDFFTVPTLTGRVLFVLVLLTHVRRRVVHLTITEHPTAAWTALLYEAGRALANAGRGGEETRVLESVRRSAATRT